jgi:hypothetical protein
MMGVKTVKSAGSATGSDRRRSGTASVGSGIALLAGGAGTASAGLAGFASLGGSFAGSASGGMVGPGVTVGIEE